MTKEIIGRQKRYALERSTLGRVLVWGQHLMSDPNFRWTKTDTKTMGILADEIRRVEHGNYLIAKRKKKG